MSRKDRARAAAQEQTTAKAEKPASSEVEALLHRWRLTTDRAERRLLEGELDQLGSPVPGHTVVPDTEL